VDGGMGGWVDGGMGGWVGEREGKGLMKQNKKTKNYDCLLLRLKKKIIIFIFMM